jgi:hypothetical protein
MRECGKCNLCCKVLRVEEISKEANTWCKNCSRGLGCNIYNRRPESCQKFECTWLQVEELPEEYRPDKVHCFLGQTNDGDLLIFVDDAHPESYREGEFGNYTASLSQKLAHDGLRSFVVAGGISKEVRWVEPEKHPQNQPERKKSKRKLKKPTEEGGQKAAAPAAQQPKGQHRLKSTALAVKLAMLKN